MRGSDLNNRQIYRLTVSDGNTQHSTNQIVFRRAGRVDKAAMASPHVDPQYRYKTSRPQNMLTPHSDTQNVIDDWSLDAFHAMHTVAFRPGFTGFWDTLWALLRISVPRTSNSDYVL